MILDANDSPVRPSVVASARRSSLKSPQHGLKSGASRISRRHLLQIPWCDGTRVLFLSGRRSYLSRRLFRPRTWLGRRIEFRPDGNVFSALAGVSLNQAPGRYPLIFGGERAEVTVTDHAYPSSKITVPEKFVAPPKEIQAQIDAEVAIKRKVLKSSPPPRLWQGPFVSPANTRYTSSFGARRAPTARPEACTRVSIIRPPSAQKSGQPTPVASSLHVQCTSKAAWS